MRLYLVDSLTTIAFFTLVAAVSEYFVAGMDLHEVLVARVTMVPLMLLTSRPYGAWRDLILRRFGSRGRLRDTALDTAAFISFQVPIYCATLVFAGATPGQIGAAVGVALLGMLLMARPFGLLLDRVRRIAGVGPGSIQA